MLNKVLIIVKYRVLKKEGFRVFSNVLIIMKFRVLNKVGFRVFNQVNVTRGDKHDAVLVQSAKGLGFMLCAAEGRTQHQP